MFSRQKKFKIQPEPEVVGAKSLTDAETSQVKPSAEQIAEVRKRAAKSKQLQAAFGQIVGLLMRTPRFKSMPLSSLEELVVPAITTGRFMIAEAQANKSGFIMPVAVVLWATVSEEVDRQLTETRDQSARLAPKDWTSGDIPWVIVAAGDQRLIKALQQRLQETVLKGRPLKSCATEKDDKDGEPAKQLH